MAKKTIKQQIEYHDEMNKKFTKKKDKSVALAAKFSTQASLHLQQATYLRDQVEEAKS